MMVIADANAMTSALQHRRTRRISWKTEIAGEKFAACDADALTVNPYLGIDGVKPFIEECSASGKGIFVLVKTSNKSSGKSRT